MSKSKKREFAVTGTKVKVDRGSAKHAISADLMLDRGALSSTQLYQLATREKIQLSHGEKDRISPDYLFVLAITNQLELSQHDKDRLRPLHIAHLAVTKKIDLSPEDKARLPTELLSDLFVQGFADLSECEVARFTAAQLEHLKELETVCSESLVPM